MSIASENFRTFINRTKTASEELSMKQDKATTLSGYGITDSISKSNVDAMFAPMIDQNEMNTFVGFNWNTNDGTFFKIGKTTDNFDIGWNINSTKDNDGAIIGFRNKNYENDDIGISLFGRQQEQISRMIMHPSGKSAIGWPGSSNWAFHSGNWTTKNLTLANGVTCSTSVKTYDVSTYLPNDDWTYMVLVIGRVTTGTTSGNQSIVRVHSDIVAEGSNIWVAGSNTRSSSNRTDMATTWLPVGPGRKIYGKNDAATGTFYIYLRGYYRLYKV